MIIGSPGAGKSTLSKTLARRTGLPVHHLDQLYWRPGWVEPGKAEWAEQVARVAAGPRWIIEGNYGGTMPLRLARADMVIDLDLPAWLCVARVLRRAIASWGKVRPDMAPDCPERLEWEFISYTASFPRRGRRRIEENMRGFQGRYIRLSSQKQIDRFLAELAS